MPPPADCAGTHPQVPVLDFTTDADIAELITLMNGCDIVTLLSCQDNHGGRGTARRVWVLILADHLPQWLDMLSYPGELKDPESITCRIASEEDCAEPDDWQAYRENRSWHYAAHVDRDPDGILPLTVSVRFPWTDLPEVTSRMHKALTEKTATMFDDDGFLRDLGGAWEGYGS